MRSAMLIVLGLLAQPALAAADDLADCLSRNADTAIAGCTRIIKDQSAPAGGRAYALFYRGNAHRAKWQFPEAIADFNRSIALLPTSQAYAGRGLTFQQQHDLARSIADLTHAIEMDPKSASAYLWRGRSYYYSHDIKRALADYRALTKFKPTSVTDYVRRAVIFRTLGEPARAIADASVAIAAEPKNIYALMVRGNAYRDDGDLDHAIADYTTAITLEAGYAILYHERGVAYRMKGDRVHAIDDFKMAVHLLPKDSPKSIAELKALGVDMSHYDPLEMPKAKDLLDSLK